MLKRLLMIAIILVIPLSVFAGENYSIRIPCTIPAIPGVNTPLIQDNLSPKEQPAGGASAIYINEKKEIRLVKGEAQAVTVQTVYSR